MRTFALIFGILIAIAVVDDAEAKGRTSSGSRGSFAMPKGSGKAIDGDTFRYKGERYRLQDYNAPELGQPGANQATQALQHRLDSGPIMVVPKARDVYGRSIGDAYVGGRKIGQPGNER